MKTKSTRTQYPIQTPYCPICSLEEPSILRAVRSGLKARAIPYQILQDIRKCSAIPVDQHGKQITTPNKWRDALCVHVTHCMGENFDEYERDSRDTARNDQLQKELRTRLATFGLGDDAEPGDLALKQMMEGSLSNASDRPMTKSELIDVFQRFMPMIIAKQLEIISMAQDEFIRGERPDAPLHEFQSTQRCLRMFEIVMGDFQVGSVIRDD